MPLYAIRRKVPGASQTDLDAAAFRAINCLPWYDGLSWIRSYFNPESEELICYYRAKDADQIRLHAERASIPCDEVVAVEEMTPDRYINA